jgi:hypothetical protein
MQKVEMRNYQKKKILQRKEALTGPVLNYLSSYSIIFNVAPKEWSLYGITLFLRVSSKYRKENI